MKDFHAVIQLSTHSKFLIDNDFSRLMMLFLARLIVLVIKGV